MKNTLLLFGFIILLNFQSYSQCNPIIYPAPGCTQITSSTSLTITSGGCYWICAGLTVDILASPGSSYYCEQNVTLNIIDSDGDQVYAKPGCVINNLSPAGIGVCGDPLTFVMNNTGGGTLTLNCTCSPLTYDYSMVAGGSPCKDVLGINESSYSGFSVFPSVVSQGGLIQIETGFFVIHSIKIIDLTGKIVQTISGNIHTVSTAHFEKGNYFMVVNAGDKIQTTRIVII